MLAWRGSAVLHQQCGLHKQLAHHIWVQVASRPTRAVTARAQALCGQAQDDELIATTSICTLPPQQARKVVNHLKCAELMFLKQRIDEKQHIQLN